MYIDKLIRREVLTLLVSVIVLISTFIGVSYALFFRVDNGSDNVINVGELEVSFCNEASCNDSYENYGQVIGTTVVNGITTPTSIYPYATTYDALQTTPYIFNIKNTGDYKTYLTVRLKEDTDFELPGSYSDYSSTTGLYSSHIKIGISNCNERINTDTVNIYIYSELNDNIIIENEPLNINDDVTYCLWTWLDETTPNSVQNTYFVANLDFKAEYIPED